MVASVTKKSLGLFLLCLNFFSFIVAQVHVFGDSHAMHCFTDHYTSDYTFSYQEVTLPLSVHYLGPKTMHGVATQGIVESGVKLGRNSLPQYGVAENDTVLFVFGEIDVRCHIAKQADQQRVGVDAVIESLATRYCDMIVRNRALYKKCTSIVMEVMPPCDQAYNPSYPRCGTIEERVVVTRQLNAKLKAACAERGILFFEIHDLLADANGILIAELSDGNVHVAMTHNYLVKQKLITFLASVK